MGSIMRTHDLGEAMEYMKSILDMNRPNTWEDNINVTKKSQPTDMLDYIQQIALGAYYEANTAFRMATEGSEKEKAALLCQTFFKCIANAMGKVKKPVVKKQDKIEEN